MTYQQGPPMGPGWGHQPPGPPHWPIVPPPKKSNTGLILGLVVGILLIAVAVVVVFVLRAGSMRQGSTWAPPRADPEAGKQMVNDLVAAVNAGDQDWLIKHICTWGPGKPDKVQAAKELAQFTRSAEGKGREFFVPGGAEGAVYGNDGVSFHAEFKEDSPSDPNWLVSIYIVGNQGPYCIVNLDVTR